MENNFDIGSLESCPSQTHLMFIHGLLAAAAGDHLLGWLRAWSNGGMPVSLGHEIHAKQNASGFTSITLNSKHMLILIPILTPLWCQLNLHFFSQCLPGFYHILRNFTKCSRNCHCWFHMNKGTVCRNLVRGVSPNTRSECMSFLYI